MNLAVYEWRKLFRLPALWTFLALCLAFNALLIAGLSPYDRAFFNETSQTAKALGQRVDEDFLAGLDAMPATENRDLLLQSVTGMEDIFETYDSGELADFYAGVVEKSPTAVKWMTWKYGLLAERVEHLAQTDAAMDLYAGPATYGSHQFLFGSLFRAVLCESAILAMLGTLYLLGYEGMHRTEGLVCSTRTGRRLRRLKVLAALPASAALYGLLAVCTLAPYFLLYDFKEGRRLFMGEDVRLQNELLKYPLEWFGIRMERGDDLDEFLDATDSTLKAKYASLDTLCLQHPTLSTRFSQFSKDNMAAQASFELGQARFRTPTHCLSSRARQYGYEHFWKNMSRPYALHRDWRDFIRDYADDMVEESSAVIYSLDVWDFIEEIVSNAEELDILKNYKLWMEESNARLASAIASELVR